jgi:hypothetical protein
MRPEEILTLRIVVLALGEQPPDLWWRSQFLTAIGLNYLTYTFPRTAFAAAVRAATLAARRVHDDAIGKGAVAHLFRLDEQTERTIDQMLTIDAAALARQHQPLTDDRAALLAQLSKLAGPTAVNGAAVGPLLVTAADEQRRALLAATYHAAFANDRQVFPYFDVTPVRVRNG